jgi:type II secretory pathway pseudopilin PulG
MREIYHNTMNRKGMTLAEIVLSMLVLASAALAVTSMIVVTNSDKMRKSRSDNFGGSLDLQAISHARATLELLKDAVSTDATRSAPLLVSTASYNTTSSLPVAFQNAGGQRTYFVSSVAGTDLRKVKVTVQWTDP